jgi:hypothetical protein
MSVSISVDKCLIIFHSRMCQKEIKEKMFLLSVTATMTAEGSEEGRPRLVGKESHSAERFSASSCC